MTNLQCSARKRRGVPLELLKHEEIDKILQHAKSRWWKRHRKVYHVTSAAGTTWINTNGSLRWALHWALKIDDAYFELHRTWNNGKFIFVKREWSAEDIELSTSSLMGGTTYLTDEEILSIGSHYAECWNVPYSLTLNNCQKLLIAVISCLLPGEIEIRKHWVAHRYCSLMARVSALIFHPIVDLRGCPREISRQYRLQLLNYYLLLVDLEGSKRFNNYKEQYNTLLERLPKGFDRIKSFLQKTYAMASIGTYSLAARYRTLAQFPVIIKVGDTWAVKTCQDIDAAGVRRTQAVLRSIALKLAKKHGKLAVRHTTGLEEVVRFFKEIFDEETTCEIMLDKEYFSKELDAILEDLDSEWVNAEESEVNESSTPFAARLWGMMMPTFVVVLFVTFFISLFKP